MCQDTSSSIIGYVNYKPISEAHFFVLGNTHTNSWAPHTQLIINDCQQFEMVPSV